jgi:hypothetical protein
MNHECQRNVPIGQVMEHVTRIEELCHRCVDVSMCIGHVVLRVVLRTRGVRVVVVDG